MVASLTQIFTSDDLQLFSLQINPPKVAVVGRKHVEGEEAGSGFRWPDTSVALQALGEAG